MAKMTVDQGLQRVHREYEGDVDYLEFDDEETELRLALILDGIREWVTEKFPEKRESFCSLSSAADGDKITTGSDVIYDAPANFIRPAGKVKIGDSLYLKYIGTDEIEKKMEEGSTEPWYTITGYPGNYKIRINPAQAAGVAINYDYYGEVTMPATTTDLIPISRPLYAVYFALEKLFKDDDPVRSKEFKDHKDEQERLERIELAKTPGEPNRIKMSGAALGDTSGTVSNILSGN